MSTDMPAGPVSGPPGGSGSSTQRPYWLGCALGLVPVIVAWIWIGTAIHGNGGVVPTVSGILTGGLYVALVVATIVCLIVDRWRKLGYGLLTMVFVGPIIWSVGCIVILGASGTG